MIRLKSIIDNIEAIPTCKEYKGEECGPWCQCRINDDVHQFMVAYKSDLIALMIASFVSGFSTMGVIWLLWLI